MSASLVGSEMCIRDRGVGRPPSFCHEVHEHRGLFEPKNAVAGIALAWTCLLYTSDAADDM
eukprot:13413074-Alexandrium_andersonii.AAC.1